MYSSTLFPTVLLLALLILPTPSKPIESMEPHPIEVFYQFPVGTWLESLYRRRNDKLLATSLTSPDLLEVDMQVNPPRVVHTFGGKTSCTGINSFYGVPARYDVREKDKYYVIAGNMDLNPFSFGPVRGSWSVYKATLRHQHHPTKPAHVSLVADFPAATMLKGITPLQFSKKWLLVGGSGAGIVYRLQAKSGKVVKVLDDPLMKPKKPDSGSFGIGINDMTVDEGYLLFTNTDQSIFARIAVHEDGTSKGFAAEVITHVDSPTGLLFSGPDKIFAQHRFNRLSRVIRQTIFTRYAPNVTDRESELFGPTSFAGGSIREGDNDAQKLFIGTNGGTAQYLTGEYTRGGTISYISYY